MKIWINTDYYALVKSHREARGYPRLIFLGGQDGECCRVGRTEVAATVVSQAVNTSIVNCLSHRPSNCLLLASIPFRLLQLKVWERSAGGCHFIVFIADFPPSTKNATFSTFIFSPPFFDRLTGIVTVVLVVMFLFRHTKNCLLTYFYLLVSEITCYICLMVHRSLGKWHCRRELLYCGLSVS